MAKKSKKISVKIIPNAGEIIQYGNKFRNIKTMKFASKRDFAKSNYKMILENPAAFKKVVKSAKGFDSYYNSFRYNGKQLKRPIRDFLLENLSQSDKKQIKEAKKKKGLVPDLNMIVNEASMNTLFNAFNFFSFLMFVNKSKIRAKIDKIMFKDRCVIIFSSFYYLC
jgi:hypothetical protein